MIRTLLFTFMLLSIKATASTITLRDTCPPSFELVGQKCQFRSRYDLYESPHNKGVGGLRTGLPLHRGSYSPQEIDLGRYLFYDPILSKNNSQSCATCHKPDLGFADGLGQSIGAMGTKTSRSAPGLWNVGFLNKLFWDARSKSLEEQAKGPLYGQHEMANTKDNMLNTLNSSKTYLDLFSKALNFEKGQTIRESHVLKALAAFQSSLISLNSPYDHYAHGYHEALSDREIKGLNIFRSFVARCAECHTPPLFTNQQIAVIGSPEPEGLDFDIGAEKTFNKPMLRGGFKVPSLRNIAKTAPYMHSGRFKTLDEAVRFYTKGRGHAVPEGERLYIHWHIWEPQLEDEEIDLLVDFLHSLTDESLTPDIPEHIPSLLD